jgi:hypothetical protein
MLYIKRIKYIKGLKSLTKFVVCNNADEIKAIFVTEAEAQEYIFLKKKCFN